MIRLILLVESRIRGDAYVRFGGEHPKTHHRNMAGRWVFSLLNYGSKSVSFAAGDLVVFPQGLSCVWQVKKPVKKHYMFS